MSPARSYLPHYPTLDGLRGIAILMVVLYHNFGFTRYSFLGWLGVDLFFVLSGFLITSILFHNMGKPNFLRNFFARRMLRIFPLYYLTVFFFIFIAPLFIEFRELAYYSENQVWLWLYLQNWLFIFHPPPTDLLSHFWSLAVEEQFYLLWPILILLIKNSKWLFAVMSVLLLTVVCGRVILWLYQIETLAYFNLYTFTRIDGICIGSMLALVLHFNPILLKRYTTTLVFLLAGANFLFFFFNRANQFSFPYVALAGYTTFAIVFGLLVNECIQPGASMGKAILELPILKFFGKISYSLYIFHWPIYVLLHNPLESWISNSLKLPPQLLSSCILSVVAVMIAYASFRFFETPFLNLKKYFDA